MYRSHSPWSKTSVMAGRILDMQNKRYLFKDPLDEEVSIPQHMDRRPDLMSYEQYGTAKYWWIFAHRNADIIIDPINDFVAGKVIRVPRRANIDRMR